MNAWLRPGYYYVIGERTHREWKRFLLIWGALLIFLTYIAGTHLLPKYYRPTFDLSPSVAASPAVNNDQPALTPALSSNYQELQTQIEQWIKKQNKGEWSVVIQDLDNKQNRVTVNPDKTYYPASIYKLFLTIPLAQKVSIDSWKTQTLKVDDKQKTIGDCVEAMLSKSDNPCGEAVGKYVGWPRADKTLRANGFTQTSLGTSNLKTSAGDTALFLEKLNDKSWFDQPTREFIMRSLSEQKYRAGIPTGCVNCTVWNKTGDLNGYLHDAAIVDNGVSKYVIVVFSKDGSYKQIANLSYLVNSYLNK